MTQNTNGFNGNGTDNDFWDLSSRVKGTDASKKEPRQPFAPRIALATVRDGDGVSSAEQERRTLHFTDEYVSYDTYSMADNSFIESITIKTRHNTGTFYRQFLQDAQKTLLLKASPCEYIPFFSYMPQYSQLSCEQLSYYLYWREETKAGQYLKCDQSYLLLYVYELINLGGSLIDADEALLYLCRLWREYGPVFPKLHKYLSLWISDFAMVHRLRIPIGELRPILRAVVDYSSLQELYLGALQEISLQSVDLFLALLSDYDWHSSRYAKGKTQEAFDKHMSKSLFAFLGVLFRSGAFPIEREKKTNLSHEAYCGAIWAHDTRYSIGAVYYPFAFASSLRAIVTNAVKYSENVLRGRLGLRSRLAVGPLDEEHKRVIDTYYRVMYPIEKGKKQKKVEPPPAYEALYEAKEVGIDTSHAEQIERLSWDTTRRLVTEEELTQDVAQEERSAADLAPRVTSAQEQNGETSAFSDGMIVFMRALLEGERFGGLPRSMAEPMVEEINHIAYDCMGDIVIESTDDGYTIVTDYLDEVRAWIEI